MSAILSKVLIMDHYIDDIIVDVDKVSLLRVVKHLNKYGLETKPIENISSARVLGLQMHRVANDGLHWRRGNQLPAHIGPTMT